MGTGGLSVVLHQLPYQVRACSQSSQALFVNLIAVLQLVFRSRNHLDSLLRYQHCNILHVTLFLYSTLYPAPQRDRLEGDARSL
jgi:hypothetical protein